MSDFNDWKRLSRDDLLQAKDYFYCEKNNCVLSFHVCKMRQRNKRDFGADKPQFYECQECEQGRNILLGKYKKEYRTCENCGGRYYYGPGATSTETICYKCLQKGVKPKRGEENKVIIATTEDNSEPWKEGEKMKEIKRKTVEKYRCKVCGTLFEEWYNGCVAVRNYCKECLHDKIAKRAGKRRLMTAGTLEISFSKHPKLLAYLKDRAEKNFRTPSLEILFMIETFMKKDQLLKEASNKLQSEDEK